MDVCGSYFVVVENGRETLIKHPTSDQEIKEHFFTGNCIGQPSVMGKSDVFRKFKYNVDFQASEDYDLWARMATEGVVFANVPNPLVKYRLHPAQASKTKGRLLHLTSKTICTNYTLAYLNNMVITEYAQVPVTSLSDFRKFIFALSAACDEKSRDMKTFRPLIALQYKKIEGLGIRSFATLKQISSRYRLDFPAKYLLNIFLLSFMRIDKNSSLFDTLTKLKL